jgi:hypothetical protein
MAIFVELARERPGLSNFTKEHIFCYNLYQCMDVAREIVDDLIVETLSDEQTLRIPPMPGAPEALTRIAEHGPLRFITARIWPESIIQWLEQILPQVDAGHIHVIATGAPEAKTEVLKELGIRFFVEDRIETCHMLIQEGIQPIVFDQPWNRGAADALFPRVSDWFQLQQWVLPDGAR